MRLRRMLVACSLAAFAVPAPVFAAPEDPDAARLALTTERVVAFKDGYCLVMKTAKAVSGADGVVWTEDVPDAAVLGSFWATPDAGRILSMTAGADETSNETTEMRPCSQYLEVLLANEGRTAAIELDDATTVRGTIRKVLARTEMQPLPPDRSGVDLRLSSVAWLGDASRRGGVLDGSLFTLTTEEGDVVLPVARVRKVVLKDAKLEIERKVVETRKSKRLTFRFEGGAAPRSLRILYFRPGVRWIPTYRVDLAQGDAAASRARIRLQAEILNEAEDFADVPFDVVVGVPNFRFKEVVSPLVLESALRDALRQAAPQLMGQQMLGAGSNAFDNRAGEWRGPSGAPSDESATLELPAEITGSQSQDLFTYSLPKLTLKKGERTAVGVFDAEVPYRDVYTWDMQVGRKDVEASPSGGGVSPLVLSDARVWHQIELVNGTKVPWTTGAALLLGDGRPLGQELLTYTSSGASVRVPVTVAIDVRARFAEEETARHMNAQTWRGDAYAKIEKKGRLEITNHKKEAVDLEVTCSLGGRAIEASHSGRIALDAFRATDWKDYNGHPAANNHSTVTFSLRVEPGTTVTPEIKYHYFTRQ